MRKSSIDGFPIPKYAKKQGLCHKAKCSYSTLRKRDFRPVVALLTPSDIKKELLRGCSGGWRAEGTIT